MHIFSRKFSFGLGILLAFWPVALATFFPAQLLATLHVTLTSSNRMPLAIFCLAALMSEAFAAALFFRLRGFPRDTLTSWSVIAAAVAGTCTLAFFVAAVANVMHVW